MLKTLYQFAELLKDEEELKEYFSPSENPFEGRESRGKVLIAEIENERFKGFFVEDYKPLLVDKYLYRKPSGPKGTGIVPTLYVNQSGTDKKGKKGIEKTADKLKSCLDNNKDLLRLSNDQELINGFQKFSFDSNFYFIVTLRINSKWLGEIKQFSERFNSIAYNKYFDQQSKGKSLKENQVCAITGEIGTVYGFVNTLGFTVNDKSFIRSGFDVSSGYKMFPVSSEIIPILEGARQILENKLAANFFGSMKYALVPHFVFLKDRELGIEVAKTFLRKAAFNADSKNDAGSTAFINDSEAILKAIIESKDLNQSDIYYAIIFFERQQAQFKIYLELNDVLPSRINKVLASKDKAEKLYDPYTSYQTKDGKFVKQRITLFRLREYFQTGEKNIQPSYFKLISSIFTGIPYDDSKLINLVVSTWTTFFKKYFHSEENRFRGIVKNSLGNLHFLHLLGIFKKKYTMNKETNPPAKQDAFSFIENHPAYFTKEYLKGIFIFGCLVTRLMYNQPGNAFMKELNGLNIDKKLVTKKFPKLIAKLRQYDKAFPEMEAVAQRCFAINDKATKDEISFAFTMGMVLQKDFDKINKTNINQNTDNNE